MRSILIIEDNATLADFIAEVLREEGYRVAVAVDGQEGLEKIRQVEPSLILTDLMMPRLGGEEVCNALAAHPRFRNTPVIVMSSKQEAVVRGRCRYDAFLPKPFDLNQLIGLVARIISGRSLDQYHMGNLSHGSQMRI